MHWVLVHSPLTGPAALGGVAREAAMSGIVVSTAQFPAWTALSEPYYRSMAQALVAPLRGCGPMILIAHSGAGGLVAAIADAAGQGEISGAVFVDAILPHPRRSWFSTVADGMAMALRAAASDDKLPAWDQWFPPGTLGALIPDHTVRKAFVRQLKPTPMRFADEVAPDVDLPPGLGCAYLRLSKTYETEAREARHRGWPTLRLDLNHLAMVTNPREVVTAIINLTRGGR